MRRGHPHHGSAFTLIETVVAVAISSVLLLKLGSTVMLASRAVPSGQEPVLTMGQIERSISLLRTDIGLALDFHAGNERILLAVPDRDNDGVPEVIEYLVNARRSLTRSQNEGAAEVLLHNIKAIDIDQVTDAGLLTGVEIGITTDSPLMPRRSLFVRLLNTPEAR